MTHVSSKKIDPQLLEKLFSEILTVLKEAQRKGNLSSVMNELLTTTEKTMFAKRLAIILMLSNGIPQHRVTEVLTVSPTTVAKTALGVEIGKYKAILRVSKKEKINVEKVIWNILTVGGIMPPKVGRKYWTKHFK